MVFIFLVIVLPRDSFSDVDATGVQGEHARMNRDGHEGQTARVSRLFPRGEDRPLGGLYLAHGLQERGTRGRPFVYTNFISSLDGRISWKNPQGFREVPPALSNPHDLRLFHELIAQADVVVTTSRHLFAVAAGRGGGMLTFGDAAGELTEWRRARGLPPHPRIAAVSASLRLPERDRLPPELGEILVLYRGERDESERPATEGYRLRACGAGPEIDGGALVDALDEDCRTVCSVAGPLVHSALLRAGRLDRLYLTIAQVLLAGDEFDTLTRGPHLDPASSFELAELWMDTAEPRGAGQLLAVFDRGKSELPRFTGK